MIDLIFSGVKAAYEEYKNLMEFGEKLGAYQEEGEDLAERIDCVMPVVFRLEGNLGDETSSWPSLGVASPRRAAGVSRGNTAEMYSAVSGL